MARESGCHTLGTQFIGGYGKVFSTAYGQRAGLMGLDTTTLLCVACLAALGGLAAKTRLMVARVDTATLMRHD